MLADVVPILWDEPIPILDDTIKIPEPGYIETSDGRRIMIREWKPIISQGSFVSVTAEGFFVHKKEREAMMLPSVIDNDNTYLVFDGKQMVIEEVAGITEIEERPFASKYKVVLVVYPPEKESEK